MPIFKTPSFGFLGLNTKSQSTGLPLMGLTTLQDMRVVGKDIEERLGMVRVAQLASTHRGLDLDGSNQSATGPVDTRVWELGLQWTVEVAFELDTVTGTQGILTAGGTTPCLLIDIDSGDDIRVRVWDSDNTLDTITVGAATTVTQAVQVTRDGATLSAKLDNGTATTATMSSTLNLRTPVGDLRIGQDDGVNYMNGTIDYVRAFSVVRDNHNDRLVRLLNPRAPHVIADYDHTSSGDTLDRSRYENHLVAQNSPPAIDSLCHNSANVRVLSMAVDENNKKQLLMAAGNQFFIAGVAG